MDMRAHYILILLTLALALMGSISAYEFRRNFWQSSYPGELLNALDSMTINGQGKTNLESINIIPLFTSTPAPNRRIATVKSNETTFPTALPQSPPPKKRIKKSDDESPANSDADADDYEYKYEQFVRKYFDDAVDHYLPKADEGSNESSEVSNLSSETSDETDTAEAQDAIPYSSASKSDGKHCRKIRKKREICIICKNPRNGERSETCSYESSSEPEKYAFETQSKYHKTRDRGDSSNADDNDDDDDADDDHIRARDISSEESIAESKFKRNIAKPEKDRSSSCIKRIVRGKSCYFCQDAVGTRALKCFNLNEQPRKKEKQSPLKSDKNTKERRRIYKRTLSYVYEKGLEQNGN